MSIVTRTGDSGLTGLFGGGRVSKASARLHAYGTVDELNAMIALILTDTDLPLRWTPRLKRIQNLLFQVGADLATPLSLPSKVDRMGNAHVSELEQWIAEEEPLLPPQTQFLLPGGSVLNAHLHLARTITRRAERWVVAMEREEVLNPAVRIFLNRLSDFFFIAARSVSHEQGIPEIPVDYNN